MSATLRLTIDQFSKKRGISKKDGEKNPPSLTGGLEWLGTLKLLLGHLNQIVNSN